MDEANESIETFMNVTGASRDVAIKYLGKTMMRVDDAVARYFEDGEAAAAEMATMVGAAPGEQVAAPPAPAPSDGMSAVDSLLGSMKGAEKGEKGSGKGSGKDGKPEDARLIAIVFFADGFMVDDEIELPEPEDAKAEQAAAPAPRRTGMMGLSDLKNEKRSGPMPKIPKLKPLRSYDTEEGKVFIDDIKAGRLPKELQKRDEAGKPIPVSIAVEDLRPRTYEDLSKMIKQMERQRAEEEKESGNSSAKPSASANLFAGAGHSLAGDSAATVSATAASGAGGSGADPALLALVASKRTPVDESKPCTTLQIRLASGARVKARLNVDNTVADIWRVVAEEMGLDAFKAASSHELSAGFPPKGLADTSVTLQAADLQNAAVTHRCK